MKFSNSLQKEYYYSIEEAVKNDSFKKILWENSEEKLENLRDSLNVYYNIDEFYIINEFLEKNTVCENIPILIELDEKDLDDIVGDKLFEGCFFKIKDSIFKMSNFILEEIDLKIIKTCKYNQT